MDDSFDINEAQDDNTKQPTPVPLVLNPYVRRPSTLRTLHPQPPSNTHAYRVLQRTDDGKGGFKYADIIQMRLLIREDQPGDSKSVKKEQYVMLFFEGAEFELERYLRYLDTWRLLDKNGEPPVLCVGRQPIDEAVKDIYFSANWNKKLLSNTKIHFIRESKDLDGFLFLSNTDSREPSAFSFSSFMF